jgi:hypothetical protein
MIDLLVALTVVAGGWAGGRGIVLLARGIRRADDERSSLWVIRGLRGLAVAVGTAAVAGGILANQRWLLAFGAIFLLEELYETGIVALVLRRSLRTPPTHRSCQQAPRSCGDTP